MPGLQIIRFQQAVFRKGTAYQDRQKYCKLNYDRLCGKYKVELKQYSGKSLISTA
jgi:hypothetical protein